MPPLPILLDTDPGVDDALALLLAARSPELELVAVTTVAGNVGLEATTRNALLILELAGRPDRAVHAGESPSQRPGPLRRPSSARVSQRSGTRNTTALVSRLVPPTAADVHGGDGLGGITGLTDAAGQLRYPAPHRKPHPTPAVEAIPQYARARPDEITLVAIGPLTNVARAAERDPEGVRRLREIVVMGGAFRCPGNITPAAEFNIFADPEAAQAVLDMGVPLRFVPLDVTEQVMVCPADFPPPAVGATSVFLEELLRHTFNFHAQCVGYPACHLHDPLAVAAVVRPDLLRFREAWVAVETAGAITRGMTVADLRERRVPPAPNCAFAEAVDAAEARDFILSRLLNSLLA